ncbi:MAG: hypothetical protein WC325_10245 [Candidatus Bathyarchaeia archaeon]|jgi:hypothetical protein
MRERKVIKKCPDGCGKDEYDLGIYRGFALTQKPFYNGWAVYAEIMEPDELDKLLMQNNTFTNKFFLDTETSSHFTLEQCENSVTDDVDNHWKKKEQLVKDAQAGKFRASL